MIAFFYRFRYFGAFLALLVVSLYGLESGKLTSPDFSTTVTYAYAVLCGAGAATRFARKKGNNGAKETEQD